jgi:sirohydrochlorin cobaltochelatase
MKHFTCLCIAMIFALALAGPASAGHSRQKNKKAIVLACFGTSYPSALVAITNIKQQVEKAFPGTKVQLAFTSNIIRRIWHHRQNDAKFFAENPNIPKEIVYVKGPLATIADLQDMGYKTIVVQPTHIFFGEEYIDLTAYVNGLNTIKTIKKKFMPFDKLVLGRPLLGKCGVEHDYHEDLEIAAKALAADVALAKKNNATLVYMGHGNEFYSTGAYIEFQQVMRKMYPKAKIFIGTVEGFPALDDVVDGLLHTSTKKVLLKPFMIVAGDHANNDMAGDEPDSWKSVISKKGIKVIPVTKGIGENNQIAEIYVEHIKDAAQDNGIEF